MNKKYVVGIILVFSVLIIAGCAGSEEINGDSMAVTEFREIEVTAEQWEFTPSVIKVKEGEAIRLLVTSIDVDHGVNIPAFGVNVPAPAGQTVPVEFVALQKGEFPLICSVYCGEGHMDHRGVLVVE
ncbi:hypothetical protein HOI26_04745 [Candidatus Woesearchaeota archaeon]|jgi:heme/copper-type cytochrome/quinol oxidase subunit 2|nr:hypothetical protein [Candidatus Woesearchaeota archaeon]MBT5740378.1 hypothetical protein [Candidatus Woesearchaeota archaeon]